MRESFSGGRMKEMLRPRQATVRFGLRPVPSDCVICQGFGINYTSKNEEDFRGLCKSCLGLGLEPIPWTELFPGRRKEYRKCP